MAAVVVGTYHSVPGGRELAACRIAQDALTVAVRQSGGYSAPGPSKRNDKGAASHRRAQWLGRLGGEALKAEGVEDLPSPQPIALAIGEAGFVGCGVPVVVDDTELMVDQLSRFCPR